MVTTWYRRIRCLNAIGLAAIMLTVVGCGSSKEVVEANQRGAGAMQQSDFEAAVESFSQVIELQPEFAGAYRNRGDAYFMLASKDKANLDKAIADYTTGIELKPAAEELPPFYQRRGKAYIAANRPKEADQDLSEVLKASPEDGDYYLLRAGCRVKLKDAEGAAADLRKVQELGTADADTLAKVAEAFALIGKFDEAIAAADNFLEVADARTKPMAYRIRGHAFLNQRKFKEAVAEHGKIIERMPGDLQAYYDRGFARLQLGEFAAAEKDFNKVISIDPVHLFGHLQRAVCREELKDYPGVIDDLSLAIEKAPKLVGARLRRGRVYVKLGEHARAIEDFTALLAVQSSVEAYRLRGLAYKAIGKHELAKKDAAAADELEKKKK